MFLPTYKCNKLGKSKRPSKQAIQAPKEIEASADSHVRETKETKAIQARGAFGGL